MHSLGTSEIRPGTHYSGLSGQPVLGGQFGTGIACEMTRLWLPLMEDVGFVVNALAMKPAKMMEKMEAWTVSFII
jgi:hypothetical protein